MPTPRPERTASPRRLTRSERLCKIVKDAGGSMPRDEAMRRIAPIFGVREARLTLGLTLAGRYLRLGDDDVLHLVEVQR
jgi:hypothetical protein